LLPFETDTSMPVHQQSNTGHDIGLQGVSG